jgi:hypothetical protein
VRNSVKIDATIDLGRSGFRFKDLHLSGSLKSTAPTTSASTPAWLSTASTNTSGQTHYHAVFKSLNGTTNGKITTNYFATTYSTTSDYRVKEDIQPVINATERLLNLNAINFQWKGSDIRTDGFLAHEVAEIIPEAVVGEKDEDELQSLDQSKIVPLLVKTIQELEARITQLENQ